MPQSTTIHSVPARWNYRRSCSLLSYDAVIYIKRRPAIKTTDDFAQYIKKAKSKKIIVANNALKNIISEMFPNAEVTVGINLRESVNMLQTSTKLLAIVPAYRIDVSFFFMCLSIIMFLLRRSSFLFLYLLECSLERILVHVLFFGFNSFQLAEMELLILL